TILKDAASTAVYGSPASAGVIVVVTHKGKSGGGLHLNLDLRYGINTPNRGNIRFLNGPELYSYQKQYFTQNWNVNQAALMSEFGVNTIDEYLNLVLPSQQLVNDSSLDYQKYGFLNSHTRQVNVSASGGNEKTRYYAG